ncbi:hypothetical protein K466DRAFT_646953 [Polyporus arcularius HHB13444]|uniref:Uncharacterized protein n=1 Tax=Polyporus arcularius HHB13444 TaxID=1314778 RepID=A0A5C3PH37_9APHY|nr:hypothetical protein K466DRAFT_646953 [Polyporus arcularius HHB13444]
MKLATYLWFFWALLFAHLALGQFTNNPTNASNGTDLVCVPFGTCEPCPDDALHEPFCQPFGNRRLMHCVPASSAGSPTLPHDHPPTEPPKGEIPAWESCGRIVEKERADFYEFFVCNLFIAILAIAVLLARSKRLQAIQARQLAARIGLVRSVPAGWSSA